MDELDGAVWRKSSYSGGASGNCVEGAYEPPGRVGIRDSKNRHGVTLCVTGEDWRTFIAMLMGGSGLALGCSKPSANVTRRVIR
jgi:Domain of unknown function (DUF397)